MITSDFLRKGVNDTYKFSISDLYQHDECARDWRWGQIYLSPRPRHQLWFGNVLHAGLEAYYRGERSLEAGLLGLRTRLNESVKEMRDSDPSFLSYIDKFEELAGLLEPILINYSLFDLENPLPGIVFQVEQYFNIPISKQVSLSGKIDLILETPQGLIIVDHKTTSSMPTNLSGLDMDEQLTMYAWACRELFGRPPIGVVYNNILKSIPKEPEVLKTTTKDGRQQLSKSMNQSTVHDVYLAKLREIDADISDYREILSHLKAKGWSSYFRREESTRSKKQIDRFVHRCLIKTQRILDARGNFELFAPNPSTYRCQFCQFLQPCVMHERGEDAQFVLDNSYLKWSDMKKKD